MSRSIYRLITLSRRRFSTSARKFDAAYDGPGKTTVSILNENQDKILVDGYSRFGFILNNNMRVMGPMAVFPDAVLQWNIKETLAVDENAFVLFELLHPKPDIVSVKKNSFKNKQALLLDMYNIDTSHMVYPRPINIKYTDNATV